VKPKSVFETILGHGFAAETVPRPLFGLRGQIKVEKSQEKCFVYGLV